MRDISEQRVKELLRDHVPGMRGTAVRAIERTGQLGRAYWIYRGDWPHEVVAGRGTLVVGLAPERASTGQLPELGHRLRSFGFPAAPLMSVASAGNVSVLVFESTSGRPVLDALRRAGMRWEISALAVTVGRLMAQLHSLAWNDVAPWIRDRNDDQEDELDDLVDDLLAEIERRAAGLPSPWRRAIDRALSWLDRHRPVGGGIALGLGGLDLDLVVVEDDEIRAVYGWERARLTDPADDLALVPYQARRSGLAEEDSTLFTQVLLASYVQHSPHSLENLPFYAVARLAQQALDAADRAAAEAPIPSREAMREVEELVAAVTRAWRNALTSPWLAG